MNKPQKQTQQIHNQDEENFGEVIPQKPQWKQDATLSIEEYDKMYKESIENNEAFWDKHGKRIDWFKPYTKVKDVKWSSTETNIRWYYDGQTNVCHNAVDRHLKDKADQTAIIWQGNEPSNFKKISYKELHQNVCRLANGFLKLGIKKGDVVTIYMPMVPEIAYAMLACARIGAVHSVIFGGFSAESIAGRLDDCKSEYIFTADAGMRGKKAIPLKQTIDDSLKLAKQNVKKVIVVKTQEQDYPFDESRDIYYSDVIEGQSDENECSVQEAEDPLFILYTSGSTGAPKGILHTTGGYNVYASMTHQYVFNYKPGQVYWCSADCGWITGHTYVIYGPLTNGATTLMYEGLPTYPDNSRMWQIIDQHQVNIFYTAPTAIRAMMKEGDEHVKKTKRTSLKVLATVGEPINPKAWKWFYTVCGDENSPIMDTWWQTETGGIMITPLVGTYDLKPGFASKPFFGIVPGVMDENGKEIESGAAKGHLVIKQSWPGQMRSVYGNHQRFLATYFSQFEGKYCPADGCVRDENGYYRITGRVDDVIIISGHNLGTAELESAFVSHEAVAEAAVVGFPHSVKGSGMYAFIILQNGFTPSKDLEKELVLQLRKKVGPIAHPDFIQFTPGLPKTRSGKIMRRILRKIVEGTIDELGDISTLADHEVVEQLIKNRIPIN